MGEPRKVLLPDGGHLNAQFDAGPTDAPVIVLSNSVLTDLRIWDGQISALTDAFSVLRYDQQGHGQSSLPQGAMTFDEYGADVLTLLDAFDVQNCIFVGLSMGVPTGLAALAQAPGRFHSFVAVDGVAKSAAGREAFWAERRETAIEFGLEGIAKETAQRWLPGGEGLVLTLSDIIAATPVDGFAGATYALQNYNYASVLDDLSLPFLAIAGAEDGAMPDAMRRQFGNVAGVQFKTVEHAGHVPNFQQPDAFNDILLAFLRSVT